MKLNTAKIDEHVWDYTKLKKDLYAEPDIIEEFDPDNEPEEGVVVNGEWNHEWGVWGCY